MGDFRINAASAAYHDGSCALDLRFKSFEIKDGKYAVEGMPAVYAGDKNAQTLEITLCDVSQSLEVVLRYGVLPELDIITRSAVFRNNGSETVILKNAASLCLDIADGKWEWIHFHGKNT